MIAVDQVTIMVTHALATCSCGQTSEGSELSSYQWAELLHTRQHTCIYIGLVGSPSGSTLGDITLEGAPGDNVEGWRVESRNGLPVIITATGEHLSTSLVGSHVRDDGTSVLSVRVLRPDAPRVKIISG